MPDRDRLKNNPVPPQEVSLMAALSLGFAVFILFTWLSSPPAFERIAEKMIQFYEKNPRAVIALGVSISFNIFWLGKVIARRLILQGQGAKLAHLKASSQKSTFKVLSYGVIALIPITLVAAIVTYSFFLPDDLTLLPIRTTRVQWFLLLVSNLAIAGLGMGILFQRLFNRVNLVGLVSKSLPQVPNISDGIILGSVHESLIETNQEQSVARLRRSPEWIVMGLKGMTGNLLITGVIGSGKSQILLQFLRQILQSFQKRPAILAIDPKRTFVRELKKIIEEQGKSDHLLWICLGGTVKFNPIWREKMLTQSAFITVANTLKLASINFLGSSGDNRFWEQSSFNLLKNSLVFCAAKYDYFTFKELYSTLIEARETSLAAELVDHLNAKEWDPEERANIEMAVNYFQNEFSQMDQKLRTSILASTTGFLNEFLEFRVSQILSPKREEITLTSMLGAIQEGKLILLHIENDALARSVGTLLKLMFQEVVLDRVSSPDHHEARYAVLIMDEYQDVATSGGGAGLGDDRYLAKARESKAITIAATQSVSSLENAIRSEPATRELLQNFRSRIFGNSTDPRTIRLFQEPRGAEEKEKSSHSLSENSQNPTRDLFFGGFDSGKSTLSESISTHRVLEHVVTAKEFARLRTFEAFAQIFDGLDTRFEKLYLKPYFLKEIRTPHSEILKTLRDSAKVPGAKLIPFFVSISSLLFLRSELSQADILFPNICSVVKSSQFRSCLDFGVSSVCMCGWPIPRPCAQLSYYVPQTFIEVWPNSKNSFFSQIPGATAQLLLHQAGMPIGVDDGFSSYAFQARSIPVPFAFETLAALPCGGTRIDKPCFDLMSEDLGKNWRTGFADTLQPQFLAWSLSPKACLLKGTAGGLTGGGASPSIGMDSGGCSYPLSFLPKYPPSNREACNGWGQFFPRTGIYEGGSRSIAALMVAARLKSIGIEVSHTIPGGTDELWQMLYPQSSSCFKEGINPALLVVTKGLREERRILGKPNGYLFVVWKKVSCCRDVPEVATSITNLLAISAACVVIPGGGV